MFRESRRGPEPVLSGLKMGAAAGDFEEGQTLCAFAHQDDDVLWMLPFWAHVDHFLLCAYPPAPAHRRLLARLPETYQDRWQPLWPYEPADDAAFARDWSCRYHTREPLDEARLAARLEPWIARPEVARIITHNPWGEYGHEDHRLLCRTVCRLACKYNKDVWCLAVAVARHEGRFQYVDQTHLRLDYIYGEFSHEWFTALREQYTQELFDSPIFGYEGVSTWTWPDGEYDYPHGRRPFVRLVKDRVDYRTQSEIEALVERVTWRVPCTCQYSQEV